jgi:F0F1-type ATP synthase assembly protein I
MFHYVHILYRQRMARSRTRIKIIQSMLIVVITIGMMVGYMVGQYIVDRYINTNHEDIDSEN